MHKENTKKLKISKRNREFFKKLTCLFQNIVFSLSTVLRYSFYTFIYKRAGACNQCGRCCRRVYLRNAGKILSSFDDYLVMILEHKRYQRFSVLGRDSDGFLYFRCKYVSNENTCSDYKRRPMMCSAYPDLGMLAYGALPKHDCGFYFVNRFTGKKVER